MQNPLSKRVKLISEGRCYLFGYSLFLPTTMAGIYLILSGWDKPIGWYVLILTMCVTFAWLMVCVDFENELKSEKL